MEELGTYWVLTFLYSNTVQTILPKTSSEKGSQMTWMISVIWEKHRFYWIFNVENWFNVRIASLYGILFICFIALLWSISQLFFDHVQRDRPNLKTECYLLIFHNGLICKITKRPLRLQFKWTHMGWISFDFKVIWFAWHHSSFLYHFN